jgi:hypothetical protein
VTTTQSTTAKAPRQPNKLAGEGVVSRFFARNGEVFMVGEQGGFCLSHAETRRCLAHWRSTETDREPWAQRMTEQMADELEAAMHQAERQNALKETMQ